GYEYGSFHFLEPSFLHNYTDSTQTRKIELKEEYKRKYKKLFADIVKASDDLKTRIESHANR
ncbi:hypothetical protein ABNE94_21055, partial [Paenibacillus larvae]